MQYSYCLLHMLAIIITTKENLKNRPIYAKKISSSSNYALSSFFQNYSFLLKKGPNYAQSRNPGFEYFISWRDTTRKGDRPRVFPSTHFIAF